MPPLDNPQSVIDYLGRYIFRIAITDNRIKEVKKKEQTVTIEYKDYTAQINKSDQNLPPPVKLLVLAALEFIRRFAQHVLPQGFQKVRYYGIYATACRRKIRPIIMNNLGSSTWQKTVRTVCQIIMAATGQNPNQCPCCGQLNLLIVLIEPLMPYPIAQPKNTIAWARPPPKSGVQS